MKNILVFPSGTDAAMEINQAMGRLIHCKLFGVDHPGSGRGKLAYRQYLGELEKGAPDFIPRLRKLIEDHAIDMILPASMEEAIFLLEHQELLHTEIMAPASHTLMLCNSEEQTDALFHDLLSKSIEHVELSEYTVCCLTDRHGRLRYSECITIGGDKYAMPDDRIERLSQKINDRLKLRGAWSYKLRMQNDNYTYLKITSGIIPEMAVCRNKGVNLAALTLFDWMGHEIEVKAISPELEVQPVRMFRYHSNYEYDHVYMDLDDTIIMNGRLNTMMMAFLFQCRNEGKKVHLITKHRDNLHDTLEKFRIHQLFDSIFWLKHSDEKYRYMKGERAIFIDDAYSERKKVAEKLGIPTFEISTVECLMDWRL
jgi:hypothetical protein